jgi:methyl-accepting chemotaxis protein
MKLRASLIVAPSVGSVVLLLCLAAFLWVMGDYDFKARATHEAGAFHQETIASVKQRLAEAHVSLYRTMAVVGSMNDADINAQRAALPKLASSLQEEVDEVLSPADRQSEDAKAFKASLLKFVKGADTAIDLASVDPNTGVAALQTADAEYKSLSSHLGKLAERVKANADADLTDLAGALKRQEIIIAVAGVLAGMGAFAFAWLMQQRIVRDINVAVQAADHVAQGRFDQLVLVQRDDEIGQLQSALSHMVQSLSKSINVVQEAALLIGQASSEIAAGNQDLSQRTESTAASLQETASSMGELTTTVMHTADSARSAHGLVADASEAARKGGSVMVNVVSNMAEIDTASRKINEIIGVIDGIAFQTNILALNAAVEAARAGEQGKGFAVVAGEVRSLAQRSANAAREIKSLISQSTERVEVGTRLVNEAGDSMQAIVSGVERVTQIIGEITNAASQEAEGIGQVNQAVTRLDQMTQQNAALVEESAASAENLRQQAQSLSQVVSQFRLAQG